MDTTLDSVRDVAPVQSFSRKSSGLVRELTLADAAWYGVLGSGGLFAFVFLFPSPQFASPEISVPLMLVAHAAVRGVVYFVYAGLGSAMPRAGGDYLYESRSLHPVVGFTVPWACQLLFWLAFPAAGAFVVTTFGLVPIVDRGRARRRRARGSSRRAGRSSSSAVVVRRLLAADRVGLRDLPHRAALGARARDR